MERDSAIEPWKLPVMAPIDNASFVSPPRAPKLTVNATPPGQTLGRGQHQGGGTGRGGSISHSTPRLWNSLFKAAAVKLPPADASLTPPATASLPRFSQQKPTEAPANAPTADLARSLPRQRDKRVSQTNQCSRRSFFVPPLPNPQGAKSNTSTRPPLTTASSFNSSPSLLNLPQANASTFTIPPGLPIGRRECRPQTGSRPWSSLFTTQDNRSLRVNANNFNLPRQPQRPNTAPSNAIICSMLPPQSLVAASADTSSHFTLPHLLPADFPTSTRLAQTSSNSSLRLPQPRLLETNATSMAHDTSVAFPLEFSPPPGRRMTAPSIILPSPRRMTAPTVLAPPFNTPSNPTFNYHGLASNSVNPTISRQIRTATDLLQVITSDPRGTFTRIQQLGSENLRLKCENNAFCTDRNILRLGQRNEVERAVENERQRAAGYIQNMEKMYTEMIRLNNQKQHALHMCIGRLGNEICRLKGGGRVYQGVWMTEQEYVDKRRLDQEDELRNNGGQDTEASSSADSSEPAESGNGKGKEKMRMGLDPSAQSFVPSLSGSSTKSDITEVFAPRSPCTESGNGEGSSVQAGIKVATYPNSTPTPNLSPTRISPTTPPLSAATPSIPDSVLATIVDMLPPFYRSICPESLCGNSHCSQEKCEMKKLCASHNSEQPNVFCTDRKCPDIHLYMTCPEELDYLHSVPKLFQSNSQGAGCCKLRGKGRKNETEKRHIKMRVHRQACARDEWRIRMAIAGLRDAHKEGRYL